LLVEQLLNVYFGYSQNLKKKHSWKKDGLELHIKFYATNEDKKEIIIQGILDVLSKVIYFPEQNKKRRV
jgi:hypothetical protein